MQRFGIGIGTWRKPELPINLEILQNSSQHAVWYVVLCLSEVYKANMHPLMIFSYVEDLSWTMVGCAALRSHNAGTTDIWLECSRKESHNGSKLSQRAGNLRIDQERIGCNIVIVIIGQAWEFSGKALWKLLLKGSYRRRTGDSTQVALTGIRRWRKWIYSFNQYLYILLRSSRVLGRTTLYWGCHAKNHT